MAAVLTKTADRLDRCKSRGRDVRSKYASSVVLLLLVSAFLLLENLLQLRTAVQIGPDEGFELAKVTLLSRGHKLYTEIWNDQPPLHTFLITQLVTRISWSILIPRLVSVACACVLICSVFVICLRTCGLLAATVAGVLLLASPEFLALSASCMLEIPSLTPAVSGLCLLLMLCLRKYPTFSSAPGSMSKLS